MVGLRPGTDLLFWTRGSSLESIEEQVAAILRSDLGGWCHVEYSFQGVVAASPYVKRALPTNFADRQAGRYLIVYPFTKSADWYLLSSAERQRLMSEHMKLGHQHAGVSQLLANSFGLDDQDFLVAYRTDDPTGFSDLVRALRGIESRRSTLRDTPVLVGISRQLADIATLLGACTAGLQSQPRHTQSRADAAMMELLQPPSLAWQPPEKPEGGTT
jgi:chlorite dismutase